MTEENKAAASAAADEPAVPAAQQVVPEAKDDSEIWSEFQSEEAKGDKSDTEPPTEAASDDDDANGSDDATSEKTAPATADEAADAALSEARKLEQRIKDEVSSLDSTKPLGKSRDRIRSDLGRLEALQRKIAAAAQSKSDSDASNARDEIAGIKDDYPEIAAPLTKALEKIDGTLDRLTKAERASLEADQAELKQIVEVQTQTLIEKHPDYVDVLKANGPAFRAWVDDQPLRIRQAAARNANDIYDGQGAIEVVEGFKKHLGLIKAPEPAPQPQTPPKLDDRRKRQLDSSASPQRSGSRPTVSGIPEEGDPEEIWNAIAAMEART